MSERPEAGVVSLLASLRDDVPPLPSHFSDRVLRRVALLGSPRAPRWWAAGPRLVVPARPVLLACCLFATVIVGLRFTAWHLTVVGAPADLRPDVVLVRFTLPARTAEHVSLSGDFNGWAADLSLERGPDGVWTATVPLHRGSYQYGYVVDGHFVTDPFAERYRADGFGGMNAVLRVGDPG